MAAGHKRSLLTLLNTHDSPRPPQPVPRTPGPQVRYMRMIVSQTPPVHALYIIISITNTTPREPSQPSRAAMCGGRAGRRVRPVGRRSGRLRGLWRPERRLGRAWPAPHGSGRAPCVSGRVSGRPRTARSSTRGGHTARRVAVRGCVEEKGQTESFCSPE